MVHLARAAQNLSAHLGRLVLARRSVAESNCVCQALHKRFHKPALTVLAKSNGQQYLNTVWQVGQHTNLPRVETQEKDRALGQSMWFHRMEPALTSGCNLWSHIPRRQGVQQAACKAQQNPMQAGYAMSPCSRESCVHDCAGDSHQIV